MSCHRQRQAKMCWCLWKRRRLKECRNRPQADYQAKIERERNTGLACWRLSNREGRKEKMNRNARVEKKNLVGAAKDFISRLSPQSTDQVATNQTGQTGRAPGRRAAGSIRRSGSLDGDDEPWDAGWMPINRIPLKFDHPPQHAKPGV